MILQRRSDIKESTMPDTAVRRLEGDEKLEAMYSLTSYALHGATPGRMLR